MAATKTPDRIKAVAEMCARIKATLASGPTHGAILRERLGNADPKFISNCLTKLKMHGEITHRLTDGTWSLSRGGAPVSAQRPAASAITTPPVPRDTGERPPSKLTGPNRPPSKPITVPAPPQDAARSIAKMRKSNGTAAPEPAPPVEEKPVVSAPAPAAEEPPPTPEPATAYGSGGWEETQCSCPARCMVHAETAPAAEPPAAPVTTAAIAPAVVTGVDLAGCESSFAVHIRLTLGPSEMMALGDDAGEVLWAIGILTRVPELLRAAAAQEIKSTQENSPS